VSREKQKFPLKGVIVNCLANRLELFRTVLLVSGRNEADKTPCFRFGIAKNTRCQPLASYNKDDCYLMSCVFEASGLFGT
jgi:hypothetical protein